MTHDDFENGFIDVQVDEGTITVEQDGNEQTVDFDQSQCSLVQQGRKPVSRVVIACGDAQEKL